MKCGGGRWRCKLEKVNTVEVCCKENIVVFVVLQEHVWGSCRGRDRCLERQNVAGVCEVRYGGCRERQVWKEDRCWKVFGRRECGRFVGRCMGERAWAGVWAGRGTICGGQSGIIFQVLYTSRPAAPSLPTVCVFLFFSSTSLTHFLLPHFSFNVQYNIYPLK